MQAFHNDPAIKEKYLSRVRQHIAADNLIRGIGWKDGKGCAVGCTLESYEHAQYPIELGIPEWLGRIEDDLFEGMSIEKSETWPEKFLDAIPVGLDDAEFLRVKAQFLLVILNSVLETFNHNTFPDVKAAIEGSISLWKRDDLGDIEWLKAARAAEAAALTVAEAAEVVARAVRATWGAGSAISGRAAEAAARTAALAAEAAEAAVAEAARAAAEAALAVRAAEAAEAAARTAEAARAAGETGEVTWAAIAAAEAVDAVIRSAGAARAEKYDYFADELLRILKGMTDDK
jgi:hypothetical protein